MPDCFVIMPVSTPKDVAEDHGGDDAHFLHVLDHLFVPAIEKAGLTPLKPIMRGADLIHAEVIRRLEVADLVLCDMSRLNANVFFELGIRTALDRPAALVKDAMSAQVPFDTGVINYHTYDSSLSPWNLTEQVQMLSEHLNETRNRAEGRNGLWRYFGLTQRAEPANIENPLEEKLDLVLQEVSKSSRVSPATEDESMRRMAQFPVLPSDADGIRQLTPSLDDGQVDALVAVMGSLKGFSIVPRLVGAFGTSIVLELGSFWIPADLREKSIETAQAAGLSLILLGGKEPDS